MTVTDFAGRSVDTPNQDSLFATASLVVKRLLHSSIRDGELGRLAEQLGRATGVSRVLLLEWRNSDLGDHVLVPRAEWAEPPVPPLSQGRVEKKGIQLIHSSPDLFARLAVRETICGSVDQFSSDVAASLSVMGIRSVTVVPIVVADRYWGCIGLEDCSASREWTDSELDALRFVADALGMVIERQRAERERERISVILANSDDAIIGKTLDGVITDWNSGAERVYGFTAEEAIGQPITILIPTDLYDEFHEIMDRLRAGERVDHIETRRIRKDGREIAVSITISPILDELGQIEGAVTVARDITERKRAELALGANEERLRLALNAGGIGAWDWYIDSGEVVWSPNMEELHGLEPGSFGGTFSDYQRGIHPDDIALVLDRIQSAIDERDDYQVEYRSLHRSLRGDAGIQWLSAQGRVVRDERGRPVRMTGVCYDITERKRNEHLQTELLARVQIAHIEADAERARLRELFQHAPAMMALLHGPDHVFELANDRYLEAVGNRDVVGKPVRDALPEVVEQGLVELLDEVFTTGNTVARSELPVQIDIRGDGTLDQRYYSFAYQPARDVDGTITGVLVHAVDLTDHVRARRMVEELVAVTASERDRLQQIINVIPEGIAISNERGEVYLSNAAAREIWGQPPPEGGLERYEVFGTVRPDGTPYPVEELPLSRTILHGETVLGEQFLITNAQSEEPVTVLVNSAPLRDSNGTVIGGVVIFQNIQWLKEFEQHKDEFLQAVSHDLKNPLTSIQGYAQMLRGQMSEMPERYQRAISNMEVASRRAVALLDEILDLTRLQMGRPLEMTLEEVDLVRVVRGLAEQHQATTELHDVVVESTVAELSGQWDEIRLERAIGNLLSNAIRYSPEGGRVLVRVDREAHDSGNLAVVSIQDEGIGIPASDLPDLFERFSRGSNVRAQFRGSGLGLAGAKAMVDAHDGSISVESVESQGSTFTVRLPLRATVPISNH